MYKLVVCITLLVGGALARPAKDELMFEGKGDTATVESTVREARAAPSHIGDLIQPGVKDAFLYVYGDADKDEGDVYGYSKRLNDKGQDGYKHFDSFHKKDGDKYGYEKHSEFGQENKANIENENQKGLEEAHVEAEGGKAEDGDETRKSYAVIEELNEDEKKQPKKKVESEYSFFGDEDSGSYYGDSEGDDEKEGAATEEDDGGEVNEEYEESEESEEGDEEDDD